MLSTRSAGDCDIETGVAPKKMDMIRFLFDDLRTHVLTDISVVAANFEAVRTQTQVRVLHGNPAVMATAIGNTSMALEKQADRVAKKARTLAKAGAVPINTRERPSRIINQGRSPCVYQMWAMFFLFFEGE